MSNFTYESDTQFRDYVVNYILSGVTSVDIFKGRFDRFDLKYLPANADKERFMEIKHRNFRHDKYPTTLIEKDKYDAITGCTQIVADVDLLILFTDGWICYTPARLKDCFRRVNIKHCPDQYAPYEDKWCTKDKEVVEILIKEEYFRPYDS